MSEGFEIGISIALQSGVGESIAAARRDAAAVELAVGRSFATLDQLRRMATGRLPVAEAPRPESKLVAKQEALPASVAEAELRGPEPVTQKVARDLITPASSLPAMSPPEPVRAALPIAHPTRQAVEMIAPSSASVANPAAPQPGATPAAAFGSPAEDRLEIPRVIAPVVSPAATSSPLPTAVPQRVPGPVAAAAPVPSLEKSLSEPFVVAAYPVVAPAAQPAARSAKPATATLTTSLVATAPLPASAAPMSSPALVVRQITPAAQSIKSISPSQLTQSGSSGLSKVDAADNAPTPAGGDVFLDGMLMGRWIARHLAREAGLPSSGPTGFDPRRSPERPGATLGVA